MTQKCCYIFGLHITCYSRKSNFKRSKNHIIPIVIMAAAVSQYIFQTYCVFTGISQVQVTHFILICINDLWNFALLLNLCPPIFSLTLFRWLCTWILPSVCKTHGTKQGWRQTALVIVCLFIHSDWCFLWICLHLSTFQMKSRRNRNNKIYICKYTS